MNTSSTTTPIKRAALLLLVLLSASAATADISRTTLTNNCIKSFPWSEDFDFLAPNTVPDCWDNSASTSSTLNDHPQYLWGVHRYNGDGNQMLRMSNYSVEPGTAIINSPMIVLPSEGEIELKFDYSHTATCGPFTVKISGDGGVTFVDLASYSRTSSSNSTLNPGVFSKAFIPLTEYAGQTVMLQFYANPNYGSGAIFVDNIEIYVPPTCRNPYNITVDNITSTTAELSWNIPADMQSYTVRYRSTQTTRLEEGFENGIDGWTLRDCDNQTGISDAFFYSGQYAFRFHFSSTPPQYLISPMLTGIDEGMSLEFYYRNRTSSYPETFQIGISFYDNEIESFVFLNEITVEDEEWHLYSEPIPSGTKYICWKYTSFNQYYLYIDDIFAGSSNPDSEWQTMTVVGNGKQVSTTLTGLTQSSLYEVQVKSNCDEAEWSEVITFNTHTDFEKVSDEYTIYSATGWDLFCDALEDNDTYNRFIGKTVKLGADISVTRMAGSSYHDFMGTFDGQGHTLTIDYGTAENPINEEYAAPFRNVESGANIHSLNVDGHIYTSKKYASGIVGCQYGTVTVNNCRSSVVIHSSKSGDGTHGGIVATQHNTLTVSGCVFDGRLLTTNGTTYCSGFVGYHNNGTCTISDCLYAPAEVNFASGESYINTGATFCRNYSGTPANCYYTKALGEAQGKLVHSIIPGEGVLMEMIGEATEYDVSGITLYGTGLMYDDVLYASNGDEVSFNLLAPESFFAVTYTPEGGTATTLTPVNGVYSFTMPNTNVVIDAVTEYLIHNATEWNNFCDALQDNDTYNRFVGKTVKLVADISVTRMAGSNYHDFMGTFDGQGHTLTVAYGSAENPISEEYAAPFRNVENGANIHSLHVVGHIYTSNKYASGIVGCQWGTVTISNCRSSVVIHSSMSGDGTHGGIVAVQHTTLTVSGCVFDGRLLTTNGTTYCSGLVGYRNNGTCTISDCLYAPAEVNMASGESKINTGATFCRNYSGTPANCYYTETLGAVQGKLAHSITSEDVTLAFAGEATEYDVSGITTCGTGLQYGSMLFAGNGEEVNLNLTIPEGFSVAAVTYTPEGGTATELTPVNGVYSFTMPNTDVVINAVTEYLIHNLTEWENFCDALQDNDTYNRFIGKTVKLCADISVTRMAGSSAHDFMGTFDGQGHTLTLAYGSAESPLTEDYAAPFRNVENGCVIENLHVDGTITTANKFAAGIVAQQYGAVTIRNCRSSVTIQSSVEGDGTHGGLVGVKGNSNYANLTIEGCMFDGKIVSTGTTATTNCGGFVGWRSNSGSLTITNSLYAPTADNNAVTSGATFARNWTMPDDANCYYTETLGTAQGKLAHTNPAVLPVGEATATYDVSDLTFYGNGVQFGEVFYYDSERNFLRTIAGYGTGNGGWQLIASPVAEVVTPSAGNGFLTNAYDLYAFVPNPSDNLEWRNYVAEPFNLEAGKGYLYANSDTTTLVFSGTPTAATAPFAVPLNYDADDDRKCWNLVCNPFACAAYLDRPYYLIDANGMGINPEPIQPTTPIPPCTAVFVKAVAAGDTAVFGTQP